MPTPIDLSRPDLTSPDLSKADLLRILARLPADTARPAAASLGWQTKELPPSEPMDSANPESTAADTHQQTSTPVHYLTRPAPRYWRVLSCQPLDNADPDQPLAKDSGSAAESASDPDATAYYDPRLPPLLSAGDWQNLWDRLPPLPRPGRTLDLPACVRLLARAEPVQRLPCRPRRDFNRSVALLLERTEALRPAWDEMAAAERNLRRLLGDNLHCFYLLNGPLGPWLAPNQPAPDQPAPNQPGMSGPDAIAADALVVPIGSFGALETAEIAADWRALFGRLQDNKHNLLLLPLCPLVRTGLPSSAVLPLPLDPAPPGNDRNQQDMALDRLVSALSQTWLPDRRRLRAMRQAIPAASLHTELCAFNHPEVARDAFRLWLKPEHLKRRLRLFQRLPEAIRAALDPAIATSSKGLDANAREVERLQANLTQPGPPEHYQRLVQQAHQAAASLEGETEGERGMHLAQFSSMVPVIEALRGRPDWHPVVRLADRVKRAGGGAPIQPPGADAHTPSQGLYAVGSGLEVRAGAGGLLAIAADAYSPEQGLLKDGRSLTGLHQLEIDDRDRRWQLDAIVRPSWAERIWSDGSNLYAAHADNAIVAWRAAKPDRPSGTWEPEQNPWPWAAEIGVDFHGLWGLLEVQGEYGKAVQRLRWIPPGRFLMGSPESEIDHEDTERLHQVTLTRGFWLGDTAVSQALWQAVTGQNPSHFKGDDLPVERISWEDCQTFIARLAKLAPDLGPALPSEAQWEYACRAGTRTPFSFGEHLHPELANYNGDYPYANAQKGLYRQQTLPVQHFDPNDWGLYQMHGNVDEWCADWYAEYPDAEVTDPAGPRQGRERVLRGGAWLDRGRRLRSANRLGSSPDARFGSIGLRLAGGFDPRAGQAGQAGRAGASAGALTADDRAPGDRALGGHGVGGGGRAGQVKSRRRRPG
ncbi:MAG: hypothetical protein N838_12400 [Thiohalocapsa sp. PB-PSB1]|jgi:formylglycine-generating enzyme required for sulfatase activity|nr:MAG: hypothetical protein N838_12400 [Thiohalocapsa sp. PB-PSB1]